MRHRNKINHLGRTASHVKAMLSNMAASLILHKKMITTLAKARVLRRYIEPLVTKSKVDSTHSRRIVFSYLQNKFAVKELFNTISPAILERPGGYIRILKVGPRISDSTEMALIEFVDFNEFYVKQKSTSGKRTRRSKKKSDNKVEETTSTETNA